MKRSLAIALFVSFAATGVEAGWRGVTPLEVPISTVEAEPAIVTQLHLRSGVLTILAGPDQPLYSFVGNDGRRLEAQPLEGLVAFDPMLGDLITRSTATGRAMPFMDARVEYSPFDGR